MNVIASQPDLFAEPILPGLSQAGAIVTPGEEETLIATIDASPLTPLRFHQWLGKRLTNTYGWSYDFDDGSFTPAEAIPDWLEQLERAVCADDCRRQRTCRPRSREHSRPFARRRLSARRRG